MVEVPQIATEHSIFKRIKDFCLLFFLLIVSGYQEKENIRKDNLEFHYKHENINAFPIDIYFMILYIMYELAQV